MGKSGAFSLSVSVAPPLYKHTLKVFKIEQIYLLVSHQLIQKVVLENPSGASFYPDI